MLRAAYSSIFSELIRSERLRVVDKFEVTQPKTKDALAKLSDLGVESAYIIVAADKGDDNLFLSVRNLSYVDVDEIGGINPVSLIKFEHVVITEDAIKEVEQWLQ